MNNSYLVSTFLTPFPRYYVINCLTYVTTQWPWSWQVLWLGTKINKTFS